uniref:Exonuclease 3'-5' domain containing 1 n=1 Tax=Xenopus tropicalis TaxID=8364 RepID=F6VJL5_XENTR
MDSIIDPGFLSRVIGKTIKITLTTGSIQGVLINVHPGRTILINKVKDLATGKMIPGAQLLFGYTILNVELQKDLEEVPVKQSEEQTTEEREQAPTEQDHIDDGSQDAERTQSDTGKPQDLRTRTLQVIKLSVDEEEVEYTIIDQFQPIFGPAFATKSRVYLFDVLVLGSKVFKNGLQMVLEDTGILKVIHDCRWLGDILSYQYGIILNNVFDTQVGDVYLFSMETGGFLPHRIRTLEECLIHHLSMLPSRVSFLAHKLPLTEEYDDIWFDRPMDPTLLKLLSLEVIHLLPLRSAMLDAMLADFTLLVEGYLNAFRRGTANILESSEVSGSGLPKELQQLRVLQQMRREKALKEYDVNNKGLLTRGKAEKAPQSKPSITKHDTEPENAVKLTMKSEESLYQTMATSATHLENQEKNHGALCQNFPVRSNFCPRGPCDSLKPQPLRPPLPSLVANLRMPSLLAMGK